MRQRQKHAIEFAVQQHVVKNGQLYGLLPFSHHLEAVFKNTVRFNYLLYNERYPLEEVYSVYDAAWLHDVLEDCDGVSRRDLIERFGERVAELVHLVTDEPGPNRKTRHALTYSKTRTDPLGVYLKLCDRIANVEAGGEAMKMYRSEYEDFKRAVYTPGQWEDMWEVLEKALLIGDREGVRDGDSKPHQRRATT